MALNSPFSGHSNTINYPRNHSRTFYNDDDDELLVYADNNNRAQPASLLSFNMDNYQPNKSFTLSPGIPTKDEFSIYGSSTRLRNEQRDSSTVHFAPKQEAIKLDTPDYRTLPSKKVNPVNENSIMPKAKPRNLQSNPPLSPKISADKLGSALDRLLEASERELLAKEKMMPNNLSRNNVQPNQIIPQEESVQKSIKTPSFNEPQDGINASPVQSNARKSNFKSPSTNNKDKKKIKELQENEQKLRDYIKSLLDERKNLLDTIKNSEYEEIIEEEEVQNAKSAKQNCDDNDFHHHVVHQPTLQEPVQATPVIHEVIPDGYVNKHSLTIHDLPKQQLDLFRATLMEQERQKYELDKKTLIDTLQHQSRNKLLDMENQLHASRVEQKDMERQNFEIKQQIEKTRFQPQLQSQIKDLEHQLRAERNRQQELERQNIEFKQTIEKTKLQPQQQAQIHELEYQLQNFKTKHRELEQQNRELTREVEKVTQKSYNQLHDLESQLQTANHKHWDLEKQNKEMRHTIEKNREIKKTFTTKTLTINAQTKQEPVKDVKSVGTSVRVTTQNKHQSTESRPSVHFSLNVDKMSTDSTLNKNNASMSHKSVDVRPHMNHKACQPDDSYNFETGTMTDQVFYRSQGVMTIPLNDQDNQDGKDDNVETHYSRKVTKTAKSTRKEVHISSPDNLTCDHHDHNEHDYRSTTSKNTVETDIHSPKITRRKKLNSGSVEEWAEQNIEQKHEITTTHLDSRQQPKFTEPTTIESWQTKEKLLDGEIVERIESSHDHIVLTDPHDVKQHLYQQESQIKTSISSNEDDDNNCTNVNNKNYKSIPVNVKRDDYRDSHFQPIQSQNSTEQKSSGKYRVIIKDTNETIVKPKEIKLNSADSQNRQSPKLVTIKSPATSRRKFSFNKGPLHDDSKDDERFVTKEYSKHEHEIPGGNEVHEIQSETMEYHSSSRPTDSITSQFSRFYDSNDFNSQSKSIPIKTSSSETNKIRITSPITYTHEFSEVSGPKLDQNQSVSKSSKQISIKSNSGTSVGITSPVTYSSEISEASEISQDSSFNRSYQPQNVNQQKSNSSRIGSYQSSKQGSVRSPVSYSTDTSQVYTHEHELLSDNNQNQKITTINRSHSKPIQYTTYTSGRYQKSGNTPDKTIQITTGSLQSNSSINATSPVKFTSDILSDQSQTVSSSFSKPSNYQQSIKVTSSNSMTSPNTHTRFIKTINSSENEEENKRSESKNLSSSSFHSESMHKKPSINSNNFQSIKHSFESGKVSNLNTEVHKILIPEDIFTKCSGLLSWIQTQNSISNRDGNYEIPDDLEEDAAEVINWWSDLCIHTNHKDLNSTISYLVSSFSQGLVKFLIKSNDGQGNSVLHYIVGHEKWELFNVFLLYGFIYPDLYNSEGFSVLMIAATLHCKSTDAQFYSCFEELIKRAQVNLTSKQHQQTALHLAALHNNSKTVQLLHKNGGDINMRDDDENTPLMIACINLSVDVVEVLLTCQGLHRQLRNKKNQTALEIAELLMQNGNGDRDSKEKLKSIIELFQKRRGSKSSESYSRVIESGYKFRPSTYHKSN